MHNSLQLSPDSVNILYQMGSKLLNRLFICGEFGEHITKKIDMKASVQGK